MIFTTNIFVYFIWLIISNVEGEISFKSTQNPNIEYKFFDTASSNDGADCPEGYMLAVLADPKEYQFIKTKLSDQDAFWVGGIIPVYNRNVDWIWFDGQILSKTDSRWQTGYPVIENKFWYYLSLHPVLGFANARKSHKKPYLCQKGLDYCWPNGDRNGLKNTTVSGIPCEEWSTYKPDPSFGVGADLPGNQCENPNNYFLGPWCYTSVPGIRWEACYPAEEICPGVRA